MAIEERSDGERSYACPENADDVAELILSAHDTGRKIRVRGALHSEAGSVLSAAQNAIHVSLHRLQDFEAVNSGQFVVVGAGTSMGGDPYAPWPHENLQADPQQSLFGKLDSLGYALPITGGISHQTISGFISTGADGGSLTHSLYEAVSAVTFVDGRGQRVTARRGAADATDAPLEAVIASLGLLGIIVAVEFKVTANSRYTIAGSHAVQVSLEADFLLTPNSSRPSAPGIFDFLSRKEYARVLWWPQPGVDHTEFWEARRLRLENAEHRAMWDPAISLPENARGTPSPAEQRLAALILRFIQDTSIATFEAVFASVETNSEVFLDSLKAAANKAAQDGTAALSSEDWRAFADLVDEVKQELSERASTDTWWPEGARADAQPPRASKLNLWERIVAALIGPFVPLSPTPDSGAWRDVEGFDRTSCNDRFRAIWYRGLPMDNPVDEKRLPVSFTEVWLPIERAEAALLALREHFKAKGLHGTGSFTVEVYAAKSNSAWLSPAFGRDVLRVDPFWYDGNKSVDRAARTRFFQGFWDVLAPFGARLHWGKTLPHDYVASSRASAGLWAPYPRLDDFLAKRAHHDPHDLFLTPYWQTHLGIGGP